MATKTTRGLGHDALTDEIAAADGRPKDGGLEHSLHDLSDRARDEASSAADDVQERADDLRGRATKATQVLRDHASDAYEGAQDWASGARETGQRHIEDLTNRTSERLGRHKTAVEQFVTENPLLVGIVGLAAGLLLGSLLPRTKSEDDTVGPWADEVRDQGIRYARDFTNRGREFVESALDPDNLDAAVQRAAGPMNPGTPDDRASRPH